MIERMVPLRCCLARRAVSVMALLVVALSSGPALAQDPNTVERARDAFDQGAAAYARKEYAQAADYFARADELIPSDEALEAAIDCATRAEDAALAMRLVDRTNRSTTQAKGLVDAKLVAQERFRRSTGRLVVRCSRECSPTIDDRPVVAGIPTWVLVGDHSVVATSGTTTASSKIDVKAERLNEVTLSLPAAPPVVDRAEKRERVSSGLSPTWVWVGAGATALLGGAAVVSGLDTLSRSDDFEKAGCEANGSDVCDRLAEDGRSARLRTNLFIGGAAVTTLATVILAAFFVDWRSGSRKDIALPFVVGPGSIAFTRSWR
jgi:hypothetical protein